MYAPTSNAEEAEIERFYEDLQDLLELTPKKRCPFDYIWLNTILKIGHNILVLKKLFFFNFSFRPLKVLYCL